VFRSVLFGDTPPPMAEVDSRPEPASFRDLNLDQITGPVTAGLDDYHLNPFFYTPLSDLDLVCWSLEAVAAYCDAAFIRFPPGFR
jgi:DNA mismatch repair protein MutS